MKDSQLEGTGAVVVTSISGPNPVLRNWQRSARREGFLLCNSDVPSPADFSLEGCEFYSLDRQRKTGLRISELLPRGTTHGRT